jgi:hypothetical protein
MLAMTLLVRDEQDIVAANVDYHLARGVDLVVATDNGSVDDTVDILRGYESQGVLRLLHEPADDYSQWKWVTRMARLAANEGADWVINADVDEFWWPRERASLAEVFSAVPPDVGVLEVARHNFPPRPIDDRTFLERMTIRDLASRNSRGRPLPPKVAHRAHPEVTVEMGNHRVSGPRLGEEVESDALEILHFPMRTYEQFENKIVKGGRALAANTELPPGKGQTWRQLYALWERGKLREFYDGEVIDHARRPDGYVEDTKLRDFMAGLDR